MRADAATNRAGHSPAPGAGSAENATRKARRGLAARPWWPALKRILTATFFALVLYLLVSQARAVEWGEVFAAVRRFPPQVLLAAAALAAASHTVYSCYDLLSRRYTDHRVGTPQVMTVTFISYAFNLNLGSLVGGIAFRYRLYSRLGLDNGTITRVLGFSMLTNWLGYLLLAGLAFLLAPLQLPPDWKLGSGGLRWLGAGLLAAALAYMLLCAVSTKRSWTVRGKEFSLPSMPLSLAQLGLSSLNWLLMGGVVFILLQQKIAYPAVLSVLLVAAVAGVITHVPAGLGVLEAVFVALLSHQLPRNELLAALLAYRLLYYLAPLAVATLAYLGVEARAKKLAATGGGKKKG
jgi:glycosyltransferase 2 family protein